MKKILLILAALICNNIIFASETDHPKPIVLFLSAVNNPTGPIIPRDYNCLEIPPRTLTWTWLIEYHEQSALRKKLQEAKTSNTSAIVFASGIRVSIALDVIAKSQNKIQALFLYEPEFSDNYYNVHNVEIIRDKNIPIIFMRGEQKEFLNSEVIYAHHNQNGCEHIHLIDKKPTSDDIGAILAHYKNKFANNDSIPFQPQLKGVGVANRYLNLKMNEVLRYYWNCAKIGTTAAFAGLVIYLLSKTETASDAFEKMFSHK